MLLGSLQAFGPCPGSGEVGPTRLCQFAHCFHGEETFWRSVFLRRPPVSHGGLLSPRRRPRGGPRQEPTGRPGRGRPPLLPGPSWPPFVAMNSGVFRREGRRRLLPRTSCLCALPGGILETENESFSVQHPLKRQLSTFLSAPTQTSHRQGDTATHRGDTLRHDMACGTEIHRTIAAALGMCSDSFL